ncbi:MAG: right-handed parallel beta-helix repeat-containing protein [Actinomycetota bacterium]|nr:right-handed parallel beta-helix repeat-containing protein [Actinomycetota bacterium]
MRFAVIALAACAALAAIPALAAAATITVNTTFDTAPALGECQGGAPSDCSLRQAIDVANGTEGPDTIVLPAGHYLLTIKGDEEDENQTGDLDLTNKGEVTIAGAGARTTVIDAAGLEDRVIDIQPGAALSLAKATVTGGDVSDENGGGIRAGEVVLTLNQVSVRGNVSRNSGRGGGIAALNSQTTIAASLIAENRNSGDGGGLWLEDGETSLVNTTIAYNVVDTSLYPSQPTWGAYGGGMEVDGGHLAMQNVTITGNSVADNNGGEDGLGAGIEGEPLTAAIVNTIVYGNTATNADSPRQCTSVLLSEGHNLEQQPPAGEKRCFEAPTDLIADPLFGPLANNGGETDTVALSTGSAAIDTGDLTRCPATDQRGLLRPQFGGCDIGAFEVQPPPPPPPPAQPTIKRRGKVKVKKAGKTFLVKPGFRVSCPAGGEKCTGSIKARAPKPKAKKKVLIGKAKFTVAPGKTKVLKLKLNSRGAEMLRELEKLRTRFDVRARAGAGAVVKAKATLKVKLPAGLRKGSR